MNAKTHNSANLGVWSISVLILSYFNYIHLNFSSFSLITTTLAIAGLYVFVDYGTDFLDFDRRLTNTNANIYYKLVSQILYQLRRVFDIPGHRSPITHALDMIIVNSLIHYFILSYAYKLSTPFLINAVGSDALLLNLLKYIETDLIGILIFGFWMGSMSHWFLDIITYEGAQLTIFKPNFKVNLVFAISLFNTGTDWELFVRKVSVKSGLLLSIVATIQLLTNTIPPLPYEQFRDLSLKLKGLELLKILALPIAGLLVLLIIFKLINLLIKKLFPKKKGRR